MFKGGYSNKAIALVSVLIFVILTSMLALTSIYLMTNQARLTEKQIRRIRAFYSSQAAKVQAIDDIFQDGTLGDEDLDPINDQRVDISYNSITEELVTNVDFSFPF